MMVLTDVCACVGPTLTLFGAERGTRARAGCRQDPGLTRRQVLEAYAEYGERQEKAYGGQWLACRRKLAKPIWHLFRGETGGKKFR